ncbi:hypothetical protein [Microlunatus speluncae]|uniref:hypothetical protein n=1 Tax=Microlunatus speluncae TaxID=2594267 RepID=UPI00126619F8|nr:hypothetical protein [Microlunatus speluncae]
MSIDTTSAEPITDGRHDFDFIAGSWAVHSRRVIDALDPECDEWVEFDGTCDARLILDGLGNSDSFFVPALPDGRSLEGFTVRLFEPETALWRIWWASTTRPGVLDEPVVGRFVDGVGTFECPDVVNGVSLLVRYRWSDITADSARWQQFFSFDDGVRWHLNWTMDNTRIAAAG